MPRANHEHVRETNIHPHALTRATIAMPQPMQVDGYNECDDEANVLSAELEMEDDIDTKLTPDWSARNELDQSFGRNPSCEFSV